MSSRWNLIWTAPWGLVTLLAVQLLVFMPIFLIGGFLVLPWLLLVAPIIQVESRVKSGVMIEAFGWGWAQALFGNWEDGLSANWWTARSGAAAPTWKTRFTWFLRNPVNNMRFWPVISTVPKPAAVRFVGSPTIPADGVPCLFLCWQGPYVGFRWQNTTWGVWIGWATNPSDSQGMPGGWRAKGFTVVTQLLRF